MGIRRAKNDPELMALRDLLRQQADPGAREEVEKLIASRLARLTPSAAPAEELIRHFVRGLGGHEVKTRREVGTKPVVYCVTNGKHVLQIGQGTAKRFKGLFPGSPCPKHSKAFVVAASNVVHGPGHRFFCLEIEDAPERRRIEGALQVKFGQMSIEGYGRMTSLLEVSRYLWDELLRSRPHVFVPELLAALELALHDGDVLYVLFRIPRYRERLEQLFDGYFKA